jgi:tRNA-specific 2-thiouridylase
MHKKNTVVVGMSGGVDSAVVAALLKEEGYNVVGVTLVLWKDEAEDEKRWQDRSCCKVGLARHVAKQLDIPHHTIDAQKAFKSKIIDDFCDTYLLGQTPNPCVRCNELIKFGGLLDIAQEMGGDLATGHYARIDKRENGGTASQGTLPSARYTLQTGIDIKKDQSYFLYRLSQEQLASTLFPLGKMSKEEVYKKASALGLPYEDILESQEICFVNQKNYQTFLEENRPESVSPGEIVMAGQVVGAHKGVAFHTIGQRRGLDVALGERVYVTQIDPVKNEVTVGYADALLQRELTADKTVWGGEGVPVGPIRVQAKIRYKSFPKEATLFEADGNSFRLLFDEPERGITPGQSVVLYQGDSVVGGGIIRNDTLGR